MRLSFKRRAETVQQSLSDPVQGHKAEREVVAFRRSQRLSAGLPAPPVERDRADPELPDRLCHRHALAVQNSRLPQRTYSRAFPFLQYRHKLPGIPPISDPFCYVYDTFQCELPLVFS